MQSSMARGHNKDEVSKGCSLVTNYVNYYQLEETVDVVVLTVKLSA